MLPFTKRPNRPEDSEVVDSGEIEVVRVAPSAPPARGGGTGRTMSAPTSQRYPAPPSDRPRVFERSGDDEMTTVMASKRGSSFPPASAQAPRSTTRPRGRGEDDESTMLRPMTPAQSFSPRPPPSARSVPPPAMVRPASFVPPPPPASNGYGLHIQTPPTMLGHTAIPAEIRAQALASVRAHQSGQVGALPYNMPSPPVSGTIPPAPPSDPFINPPATVITTRTRVLIGRPTMSWAAALLAMGVFVGLVTAVVARGDADSILDATASFVDPAHSTARAAAASQPVQALPALATLPIAPPAAAPIAPPVAVAPAAMAPASILPPASTPPSAPVQPATPVQAYAPTPPVAQPLPPIPLTDSRVGDPTKTVAANDLPSANAAPEKPKPVAYVAPKPETRYVAPRAYARPAAAAPAPRPAAARAARKAAAAADDEGAAAADKLAREQLEAALK